MDPDIRHDRQSVPTEYWHLLDQKQANRDEAKANADALKAEGHLVIDDVIICDIVHDLNYDAHDMAFQFGYAPQHGLSVYLGAEFSWQYMGEIEPIYMSEWLTSE